LKLLTLHAETTSSGREFHILTNLFTKKMFTKIIFTYVLCLSYIWSGKGA